MDYILFEHKNMDLNFRFSKAELKDFKALWKADISVENIAKKLKRKPLEIVLLVIDQGEIGLINQRASGLAGL